jgi:hypothetical protein
VKFALLALSHSRKNSARVNILALGDPGRRIEMANLDRLAGDVLKANGGLHAFGGTGTSARSPGGRCF